MTRRTILGGIVSAVGLLLVGPAPAPAGATEPRIARWNAVTTNSDGSFPLARPLVAYNVYIDPPNGVVLRGVTTPTATVAPTTTTWPISVNLRAGHHTITVTAVDTVGESAAAPLVTFVIL